MNISNSTCNNPEKFDEIPRPVDDVLKPYSYSVRIPLVLPIIHRLITLTLKNTPQTPDRERKLSTV